MSGQGIRSAYDRWHRDLPVEEEAGMPWHHLVRRAIVPERDLAGKRVLEIGTGRGELARWLASRELPPRRVVAADFAQSAVAKGKGFAASRALPIAWEVADIEALGHPDGAFDTVVSCETIEHVPSPQRAARELARVLKPGGHLFLTTPNYLGTTGVYRIYSRLRGRVYREAGQPINNLMLLPWTREIIRRAGLRIVTVDAVGHYVPMIRRPPLELAFLDRWRLLTRWFALHSLVVARKP
jgi:2-polyprenyl-3-methyl-5-hydroxy-6-metoxy-1,4-benzoquinol methylase